LIAHISGIVSERSPTRAVIDVDGVGYAAAISLSTYEYLPPVGERARLLTHTYVREDRLELFGFAEEQELLMFRLLIGVSGIGPNSAIAILSGTSADELREAIVRERPEDLTRVRGIGPKSAQRIVIDLRDKVQAVATAGTPAPQGADDGTGPVAEEAVLALVSLGIAAGPARKAVEGAIKRNGTDQSVQALIKQALQER
jgi:Holliday junction DNA helicase RuvA